MHYWPKCNDIIRQQVKAAHFAVFLIHMRGIYIWISCIYSKSCSTNPPSCQIIWGEKLEKHCAKIGEPKNPRECSFITCQHSCIINRTNSVLQPKVLRYPFSCAGIISEPSIERNNYTVTELCSDGGLLKQQSSTLGRKRSQIKWDSCQSGERLFIPET